MPQIPPVLNVSTYHVILIFSQEPLFPKEQFKVENDCHCNEAQPKPKNAVTAWFSFGLQWNLWDQADFIIGGQLVKKERGATRIEDLLGFNGFFF